MNKGKIKNIPQNKSFGFIARDDGDDLFFHKTSMIDESLFEFLRKNDPVSFESISKTEKGYNAIGVHVDKNILASRQVAKKRPYGFHNPYNFVQLLHPTQNYTSANSPLLKQACINQDKYEHLSGEIDCTYTVETPLFISGERYNPNSNCYDHFGYNFFSIDGKPLIPASSIRGMIRSVFEAATNSCMCHVEDQLLDHRVIPDTGFVSSVTPGRIILDQNENKLKFEILPGDYTTNKSEEKDKLQKVALIRVYDDDESKQAKISRAGIKELVHGNFCKAVIPQKPGKFKDFQVLGLYSINTKDEFIRKDFDNFSDKRIEKGYVFCTYQNIKGKRNERFFYRADGNTYLKTPKEIDQQVIDEYNYILQDYSGRFKEDKQERLDPNNADKTYEQPELSRFIMENETKLKEGDLVYAEIRMGIVDHLFPVAIPRFRYKKSIGDIINMKNSYNSPCGCNENNDNDQIQFCPACRIFGWVESARTTNKVSAISSRVAFSNGEIIKGKLLDEKKLTILDKPKPTTCAFYLSNKGQPDFEISYNKSDAQIRGRKFYHHHQPNLPDTIKDSNQNRRIRHSLSKGSQIKFNVKFENLCNEELGALIWSLKMEDDMMHKLGFGKPLGFGSLIPNCVELKLISRYEKYNPVESTDKSERQLYKLEWNKLNISDSNTFIKKFKSEMKSIYGKEFYDLENIKDLMIMLGKIENNIPVHYPRPPYHNSSIPNPDGKNFEWFVGNKKAKIPLPLSQKSADRKSVV